MQFVNRTHRLGRGLVGLWLFNESSGNTAADLSGNGNAGSIVGATWVPEGLNFVAASSQYASALPPASISTTLYTIVVDFKTGSAGTARPINMGNTNETQHFTALDANVGNDFTFWYSNNLAKSIIYTTKVPVANTRYMLAGVSNGIFYKAIYIDGILVESSLIEVDAPDPYDIIGIGALIRSTIVYSDCDVYSILIYNRALSTGEIAELYAKPFVLFQKDNTALIASVAAPPAGGGQFIMIQMSMIPLLFIFTIVCFIKGRNCVK